MIVIQKPGIYYLVRPVILNICFLIFYPLFGSQIFSFPIELKEWEVNLDGTWQKTQPIFWEAPVSQGGLDIDHNGYGRYRTRFSLEKKSGHGSLAFYTPCIDDADMAFLNGRLIGETGKVPPLSMSRPIDGLQSGVREARLYPIPEIFLNDGRRQPNVLEVVVFDLAGNGGFCFKQTPVIGSLMDLNKLYVAQRLDNDIPRWIVISILLILSCLCTVEIIRRFPKRNTNPGFLKLCLGLLNNTLRVNTREMDNETADTLSHEKIFRLFALCMSSCMVVIFLFSEIPAKYRLIQSENFWFKFPPFAFYIAIYFSQSVFHYEAFGRGRAGRTWYLQLLYVLSHPYAYLPMMIFLIFSSPEYSWSYFVSAGLVYALIIHVLLGTTVLLQLARYVYERLYLRQKNRSLQMVQVQMYFRILSLLFFAGGFFLFYLRGNLFGNSVLIMGSFYNLTLLISTYFFVRHDIILPLGGFPLKKELSVEFDRKLKSDYGLSKTQIIICREIRMGLKRSSLQKMLGLSNAGLKHHLKSIYLKTIDKQPGQESNTRDKLQRLTIFLMRIND